MTKEIFKSIHRYHALPIKIPGEPAIVIGYGPHNDGTSLNKANQRVYPEELCSDKYSVEAASTNNAKLIKTELPNGFDDTLICSGKAKLFFNRQNIGIYSVKSQQRGGGA